MKEPLPGAHPVETLDLVAWLAMRLVLFDIDGTLLSCGDQVRGFLRAALEEVFGTAGDLDNFRFSGRTDPSIALDLLTATGISREEVLGGLPELRSRYLVRLQDGLERRGMRLFPGVLDLLQRLAASSHVSLGLLTGNWREGARIKLSRFDLNRFFAFGAFGDDGVDRRELPPVALERARKATGRRFLPADTLIIGDAPADIACARAHGVSVLAVATGWTPMEVLEAEGADWVLPTLEGAHDQVPALRPPEA